MSKKDMESLDENMEPDEEVSIALGSDEDSDQNEICMGSIAATTLAALSLHDSQRPRSAMSGPRKIPTATRRKRTW